MKAFFVKLVSRWIVRRSTLNALAAKYQTLLEDRTRESVEYADLYRRHELLASRVVFLQATGAQSTKCGNGTIKLKSNQVLPVRRH